MERVAVIIVNYKNASDTLDCIESILKSKHVSFDLDIIVVDNGSMDGSLEKLIEKTKGTSLIHILGCKENKGFSAGNNVGIRYAIDILGSDYILLLNDDTIILEDSIEFLYSKAEPDTVVVPKIMYYYDKSMIWYAGGYIDKKRGRAEHIGINEHDSSQYSIDRYISFASGCCMMIHRNVIERVGLLDESYFLYWEDVDYSIRLTKNNINILFVSNSIIFHKVSASTGKLSRIVVYYGYRNQFYFLKKYQFGISAFIYTYLNSIYCFLKGILLRTNQRIIPKAWLDYKKGIRGKIQL